VSGHHPSFLKKKKKMDWARGRQGKNEAGRKYTKTRHFFSFVFSGRFPA
jgi:hypothetical protein